jgi:acetyl esterase/lipase
MKKLVDIEYRRVGERRLLLDVYLPDEAGDKRPTIVWIHGGGWRKGTKAGHELLPHFAERGYVVASISYRLSSEAIFPAQIQDCKAALRWLRSQAGEYGIDPDHIGVWGSSAGGHLVALLGTSGHAESLEGPGNPGHSSRVQAVCDWFGPTDFLRMDDHPSNIAHNAPDSPESMLVGGPIQERVEAVASANPITYVSDDAPPFLIMHGDQDTLVPWQQSQLLHEALLAQGVDSTLKILPGAGHGTRQMFFTPENVRIIKGFFDRCLRDT